MILGALPCTRCSLLTIIYIYVYIFEYVYLGCKAIIGRRPPPSLPCTCYRGDVSHTGSLHHGHSQHPHPSVHMDTLIDTCWYVDAIIIERYIILAGYMLMYIHLSESRTNSPTSSTSNYCHGPLQN